MSICGSDRRPDARLGEAGALPGERGGAGAFPAQGAPSVPAGSPEACRRSSRGFTFPPWLLPQDGGGRATVGQMRLSLEAADTAGPLAPPDEPQLGAASRSMGLQARGSYRAGGGPMAGGGPARGTRGQLVLKGQSPRSVCMKPAGKGRGECPRAGQRAHPHASHVAASDMAPWQQSPLPQLVRKADLVLLVRLPPPLVQSWFAW